MGMALKHPKQRLVVKTAEIHFPAYLWLSEEYKEVISFTLSHSTVLRLYNMPFSLSYHFLLACFTDWALAPEKPIIHDHYGKYRVYS